MEEPNNSNPSKPGYVHVDFFPAKAPASPAAPAPSRNMGLGAGAAFYLLLSIVLGFFAAQGKGISLNTSVILLLAAFVSALVSLFLFFGWVLKKVGRFLQGL